MDSIELNKLGFLITAYKQIDLTRENIERIRNKYKIYNDSWIVVVSTAESQIGFKQLENEYDNVHVIEYLDAPYNPNSKFINKCNYWFKFQIIPRILLSIEKGLEFLQEKCSYVLHLHSDTYFDESAENNISDYLKILNDKTIVCYGNDMYGHDPHICLHPEGMFLNLRKCYDCGYGYTFSKIFDGTSFFQSHIRGGIEFLLAEYLYYCVTGKNFSGVITDDYLDSLHLIEVRYSHGFFKSGLVNLSHAQENRALEI